LQGPCDPAARVAVARPPTLAPAHAWSLESGA
jgi:hypothetical protein